MPDQVERFSLERSEAFSDGGEDFPETWDLEAADDGPWVRYSDYEKLEATAAGAIAGRLLARDRADRVEAERDQARKQRDEELRERLEREFDLRLKTARANRVAKMILDSIFDKAESQPLAQCPNTEHKIGPHPLGAEGHARDKGPLLPCPVCVGYLKGPDRPPKAKA